MPLYVPLISYKTVCHRHVEGEGGRANHNESECFKEFWGGK